MYRRNQRCSGKDKTVFLVDNLENLVRAEGSPRPWVLLGLVGIRPILTVGKVVWCCMIRCVVSARGCSIWSAISKAAKKAIIEKVGIAHVDALEAESLRQMLGRFTQGQYDCRGRSGGGPTYWLGGIVVIINTIG